MGNPPRTPESINFDREVKKRRKRVKITQDELAERLNVVRSYISQIETGATQCREDFAQRMDEALETEPEIHNAWREFIEPLVEDKYPKEYVKFSKAEKTATQLRIFEIYLICGLVQSEAYANVLLNGDLEAFNTRMQRQSILRRSPAPFICIIMDASVLYRQVGSTEVMREQLELLIKASELDNVCLQITPFAYHHDVRGSFAIATQPDRREVVYSVSAIGGEESSTAPHLARVSETFARLQSCSLSPEETRAYIRKVIEERWT